MDETFCSRLFSMSGMPQKATVEDAVNYPPMLNWDNIYGALPYYAMNALAVDRHIYQFVSTDNLIYKLDQYSQNPADLESWSDNNFTNTKLIYSPNDGRSWHNQDGSSPVHWESKESQSPRNMAFFHEPQGAFANLSFLQMGQGYRDNRDGYVYVYGPNGAVEGTINELVMFRVPTDSVLDRSSYEYFAGLDGDGAVWAKDINSREIVHTFPPGLTPRPWPIAWTPSVTYNAALGVYMMVNCSGIPADCVVPKPTYLGIWIANQPWGPWKQIHEETAWTPGNDPEARATAPQFAPKWILEDGKSFWLVWTDARQIEIEGFSKVEVANALFNFTPKTHKEWMRVRKRWGQAYPYFGFNAQRVDLIVA